jgi:hypothetical protein
MISSMPHVGRAMLFRVRYAEPYQGATSVKVEIQIICDLCGEPKNCAQKEIEGREYNSMLRAPEAARPKTSR